MNIFIALAPVVKMANCTSGIIKKMSDNENIEKMMRKMGIN